MAEKREALLPNNQHYTNRIDGTILYIYMMSMRLNWKREYAFLRNKWHNNIGYVSGSWWKSIGYDDEWRRVWKCSSFIIPLGQVHACSHVRKLPLLPTNTTGFIKSTASRMRNYWHNASAGHLWWRKGPVKSKKNSSRTTFNSNDYAVTLNVLANYLQNLDKEKQL